MKMTPEQISRLVDGITPDIRIALRTIFETNEPVHAFDLDGTTDGVKTPNSHSVLIAVLPRSVVDALLLMMGPVLAGGKANAVETCMKMFDVLNPEISAQIRANLPLRAGSRSTQDEQPFETCHVPTKEY